MTMSDGRDGHDNHGGSYYPSLADRLKLMDGHSSVQNEFRVRTSQGALLSVTALLLIFYLILTEYRYNFMVEISTKTYVEPRTPDGLELEFDITFPNVNCALLSVDANDQLGQSQSLHLDRTHRVWKHRLDSDGNEIGRRSKFELGNTIQSVDAARDLSSGVIEMEKDTAMKSVMEDYEEGEEACGSCYGAEAPGECCNTCDDVKRAYMRHGWYLEDLDKVKQCQHTQKSKDLANEGCNVHGIVALSTGGGNLHVAPGRTMENYGRKTGFSIADFMNMIFETFNVTHTIHKLRFGPEYPGQSYQLDGQYRSVSDAHGMYQYYFKIVPTRYKYLDGSELVTNQFSVTEHMRHVNPGSSKGVPGVYFFYEVSPFHVEIAESVQGWIRFMTSVCAIVGGVFTLMGMTDNYIYSNKKGSRQLPNRSNNLG